LVHAAVAVDTPRIGEYLANKTSFKHTHIPSENTRIPCEGIFLPFGSNRKGIFDYWLLISNSQKAGKNNQLLVFNDPVSKKNYQLLDFNNRKRK
jgi:hypothetical protein